MRTIHILMRVVGNDDECIEYGRFVIERTGPMVTWNLHGTQPIIDSCMRPSGVYFVLMFS